MLGLIIKVSTFDDIVFKKDLHTIHQRHRRTDGQTDRWTDRQTTCDRNTALCTKVHRAVKMKNCRCALSSEYLKLMQLDWNFFLKRITGDESWIHHYDPESKQQSMQWKYANSPSPRKFKVQASAGKIMCSIFWDAEGMLLIDFMPQKVTITGGLLR